MDSDFQPDNNTVRAVLVRHPFDRLIIEYKHQKYQDKLRTDSNELRLPGRQVLFSRHRTGHGRKKNKREFREFIASQVLTDNSSVHSVSQVGRCQVTNITSRTFSD